MYNYLKKKTKKQRSRRRIKGGTWRENAKEHEWEVVELEENSTYQGIIREFL